MYAVIETGGKQYRVSQDEVIKIEKLNAEVGDRVEFDRVLVVGDGTNVKVGTPYLDSVKITGVVLEQGRSEKVVIFKYMAKKDFRKKRGHRQPFTLVQIDGLEAGGGSSTPKKTPAKKEAPKKEVSEDEASATSAEEPVAEKKAPAKKAPAKAKEDKPATEKKAPAKAKEDKPAAEKKAPAKAKEDKPAAEKKAPAKKAPAKKDVVAEEPVAEAPVAEVAENKED